MSTHTSQLKKNDEHERSRRELINNTNTFVHRHIGPNEAERGDMLDVMGLSSLDELIDKVVPDSIRQSIPLDIGEGRSEESALAEIRNMAARNKVFRSFVGMGFYDTVTPPVILRNILENPGWYTQYTPYQPEISQGRLEALLNFQTMINDLTGMDIANASLLDEGTAAAEAMRMSYNIHKGDCRRFFVSEACHPQTIAVIQTRAAAMGIDVVVGDHRHFDFSDPVFGVLVQYPTTEGFIYDYSEFADRAHRSGALLIAVADILGLTMLRPPAEFGADIATGSTQRFGIPMGYGGPSAAYLATRDDYKRFMPGRLIGVSKDAQGKVAYRLALQTREQHIRREKATSNICTAQVLLAVMASMYAVYHGAEGLKRIAQRIHLLTGALVQGLRKLGHKVEPEPFFDTIRIELGVGRSSAEMSLGSP